MTDAQQSQMAALRSALEKDKYIKAGRKLARIVTHTDPSPQAKARRTKLEGDLAKWIRYYGHEAFYLPFSSDHLKVIGKIDHAIKHGGTFALALPRGAGKTTICKWAFMFAILTGARRYVMAIAATSELALEFIDFAKMKLTENDRLHEHYPHITTYCRALDSKAINARYQLRVDGKATGIKWGKEQIVLPTVTSEGQTVKGGKVPRDKASVYPGCGAILEARGITGAIRGRSKDDKSGKPLRPDFAIIDDPSTRESAESGEQNNKRERTITGDILGLAGPRKKIAAVMPCTIIRRGDLADRFLSHETHPEWSGIIGRMVDVWPDAQDTLWAQYASIYRQSVADGLGFKPATEFYKANRQAMDAGAVLSWKERVRDGEISVLQTAENILIEQGDQFWAEYQNEPKEAHATIYDLTAELVSSRIHAGRRAGDIPADGRIVVAATDLNHYGLHNAVVAFSNDATGWVVHYGAYAGTHGEEIVPKNCPETEGKRLMFEALCRHGEAIAQLPLLRNGQLVRPDIWLVDAGYMPDIVRRYLDSAARAIGVPVMAFRGFSADKYRPTGKNAIGKPREQCHLAEGPVAGRFLAANVDYWREVAQRAWLGEPNAPGSLSLPEGRHREFAEQVTREKLVEKLQGQFGAVWRWHTAPGWHDYGDAVTMCYVGAAWGGIGTTGSQPIQQRPKRRATIRMV